jgi:hypothetical protein
VGLATHTDITNIMRALMTTDPNMDDAVRRFLKSSRFTKGLLYDHERPKLRAFKICHVGHFCLIKLIPRVVSARPFRAGPIFILEAHLHASSSWTGYGLVENEDSGQ